MTGKVSAGLLPYRFVNGVTEVFLVHPGGPFWKKRDHGAWSIAKGEVEPGEALLDAARREFEEETGVRLDGPFIELTPVQQAGGKRVHAWSVEADIDADVIRSNTFSLEWPPRSGLQQTFPEVDRAAWFTSGEAQGRLLAGQRSLVVELLRKLDHATSPAKRY